jgi:hypothetical protein
VSAEGAERQRLWALRPREAPARGETAALDLEEQIDLVGAWCAHAIAARWDSGRILAPRADTLPFEDEVWSFLSPTSGLASEQLDGARAAVARRESAGPLGRPGSVLTTLATEFCLSRLDAEILMVVAAPSRRGELARLYAILSNDPARPVCDELLVAQILERARSRGDVAAALDPGGPLQRSGMLLQGRGARPFSPWTAHPIILRRLRGDGDEHDEPEPAVRMVSGTRRLEELVLPPLDDVMRSLEEPRDEDQVRLCVRGRAGSGRKSLVGALAARANRVLGIVDLRLLMAEPDEFPRNLADSLRRVVLRGGLPLLLGVDALAGEDPKTLQGLRVALARHPGPLAVSCGPGVSPPLDPGYLSIEFVQLSEGKRRECFAAALSRHGLSQSSADALSSRYRIEPGTIEAVCARVAARGEGATEASLEAAIRQHRDARIGNVATLVPRLADWSHIVLPPDVTACVRELISRVRHRRQVYETWGFDRLITSARGLTALFQGVPGTGKTLVAGAVARELGLDLYRVDLSRVLSKWIGETEQNLAAVFDAADDGQAVILFDEADALFARRTDVKSSVDRYANVEVNFLLQRLDSFEGISVLTTNNSRAIDNAFKRRLSMQVSFPFPDESLRERIWRVHLPDELPKVEPLDLASLARRYRLSGGYIRNAALRAAFLAAAEGCALTQDHLERAVKLEYEQVGKLADGGPLE